MIKLHAATATDAGRVRTSNQDRALVAGDAIVVADGMGGHAGGEIAASTAVEAFARAFHREQGVEGLRAAADAANREVFSRAERDKALRGMGTTLTAAALVGNPEHPEVALVNIGDSRAYLFDNGHLEQLTEDHSLVEEMVRRGELTPEAASTHPHRHILTRALGIDPGVDIDSWLLAPSPGSRLLLCSDGLTNECTEAEIAEVLSSESDPAAAARVLVERALAHGGSDNITVIVADLDDSETPDNVVPLDLDRSLRESDRAATDGASSTVGHDPGDTTTISLAERRRHAATMPTQRVRAARPPRPARQPRGRSPRPTGTERRAARRAARRTAEPLVTFRVALFSLLIVGVLGGIAGFVVWFNRATYFVGIDASNVAIYEGRPGGFLWFHPTLVEETAVPTSSLLPSTIPLLQQGILESSYDDAKTVVTNLSNEHTALGFGTVVSTTTTSVTTTTVAAVTTTTTKKKG